MCSRSKPLSARCAMAQVTIRDCKECHPGVHQQQLQGNTLDVLWSNHFTKKAYKLQHTANQQPCWKQLPFPNCQGRAQGSGSNASHGQRYKDTASLPSLVHNYKQHLCNYRSTNSVLYLARSTSRKAIPPYQTGRHRLSSPMPDHQQ
jgi:hypothetical protein